MSTNTAISVPCTSRPFVHKVASSTSQTSAARPVVASLTFPSRLVAAVAPLSEVIADEACGPVARFVAMHLIRVLEDIAHACASAEGCALGADAARAAQVALTAFARGVAVPPLGMGPGPYPGPHGPSIPQMSLLAKRRDGEAANWWAAFAPFPTQGQGGVAKWPCNEDATLSSPRDYIDDPWSRGDIRSGNVLLVSSDSNCPPTRMMR